MTVEASHGRYRLPSVGVHQNSVILAPNSSIHAVHATRIRNVAEQPNAQTFEACKEIVGLQGDNINIEFTQRKGDELCHTRYGGLSDDRKLGEHG